MKTDPSENLPDDLSKTLKEWRVEGGLPPGFQSAVWRRIDQASRQVNPSLLESFLHWISRQLARPALAVAYFALLISLGATFGWTHGRLETARVQSELAQRYVRTLDPNSARP